MSGEWRTELCLNIKNMGGRGRAVAGGERWTNRSFLQIAIKIKTKQNGNPFRGSTLSTAARTLIESDVKWTAVKPKHGRAATEKPLPESVTSFLRPTKDIKFKGARRVRYAFYVKWRFKTTHNKVSLAGPCERSKSVTKTQKAKRQVALEKYFIAIRADATSIIIAGADGAQFFSPTQRQ